jgi:hypothetical protein
MLDFTKIQKKVLNIKLIDGNEILVRMPTKRVFDLLMGIQDNLSNLNIEDKAQIALVYDLTAKVLSNNLYGKKIDAEYLADLLDVEDISILFASYVEFVVGKVNDPNSESPQSQARTEGESTESTQNGNA